MPTSPSRSARFDPTPPSVASVRRFCWAWCGSSALADEDSALVVLAADELATNVVLHAGTAFAVELSLDGDLVHLTVSDESRRLPRYRQAGTFDGSGRGLPVMEAVAEHWSVALIPSGKRVRADIRVSRPRDP